MKLLKTKVLCLLAASVTISQFSGAVAFASEKTVPVAEQPFALESSTRAVKANLFKYTYIMGSCDIWGHIYGDSSWDGQAIKITNPNSKTINVIAYSGEGAIRGGYTLENGETAIVRFKPGDGTYLFKTQFSDYSAGYLGLSMQVY